MKGKIPSVIKWTRSDYAKLNWAVRQFNKTVSKLESMELEGLPNLQQYKDLKENIYSRRELNRIVKSLKRFGRESQQRLVTTEGGEVLTQWEYSELKKAMRRATTRITDEARNIIDTDRNVIGDVQFKRLLRTKESIEDLMNRKGAEFRMTKERAMKWGKLDYELFRAEIFRENFMNALEELSDYKNFDLLKQKLESISNPIRFYNYISQSEILKDLFLFYKDKATSQTYGGFTSNQEAFDTAIFEQLKIKKPNEE